MKNVLVLVITFSSFVISYAQQPKKLKNIDVDFGIFNPQEKKMGAAYIYKNSVGTVFTKGYLKGIFYLQKHDDKGKIVGSMNVPFKKVQGLEKKMDVIYDNFFALGENFFILIRQKDKKNKKYIWKVIPLNTKTMTAGEPRTIHSTNFLKAYHREEPYVTVSPNDSLIAFGFMDVKGSLGEKDFIFTTHVFDQDFNKLTSSKIDKVEGNYHTRCLGLFVNNFATMAVVETEREIGDIETGQGKKMEKVKYLNKFKITVQKDGANASSEVEIPVNNITSGLVKIEENGELVGAGFYSKSFGGMDGIFVYKFNMEEGDVTMIKANDFIDKVYDDVLTKREEARKEKLESKGKDYKVHAFPIIGIELTKEGEYRIISEEFYTYTQTYRGANNTTVTVVHYVHQDLLIFGLDNDGNYKWHLLINKHQDSTALNGRDGIAYLEYDGKLLIVYADSNTDLVLTRDGNSRRNNGYKYIVGVAIDTEGKPEKGVLYETAEVEMNTPVQDYLSSENRLTLRVHKKRDSKIVNISFKD